MNRLKKAITGKGRWVKLKSSIALVDSTKKDDPNVALDSAKSILEMISKTILKDKGIQFESDSNLGYLVKKAFASLPVFVNLSSKDQARAKSILGSFENVAKLIGEYRNDYGSLSHGRDIQAEKFDKYLADLAISSADLLASFLIISHGDDLKDRSRVYYEENDEFNRYIDDSGGDVTVAEISLSPSKSLYTDSNAYKEELLSFINEKEGLIKELEASEKFVSTRSVCSKLIELQSYLTEGELKRIVKAGIDNPQVNRILGHGYTKALFSWILTEKYQVLTTEEKKNLEDAFSNTAY